MSELSNRVALVTGGSRGIGRATAIELASAGADVAVNYLTSESAAIEVVREIERLGRRAIAIKADVSEQEDIESLVEIVGEHLGRIDILISNAAGGGFRNIMDASAAHFDVAMRTNVRSLMFLAQAAVPWMNRVAAGGKPARGKIIALSSHGSHRALEAYGLIGASKAALESMIRHLALELGPRGINCNSVLAGLVETDSTRFVPNAKEMFDTVDARLLVGEGRRLTDEDVAHAVRFLASPASDLVQGHTLVIDGGATLHG